MLIILNCKRKLMMESIQLISVKEFCDSHGVEQTYLLTLQEFGFVQIKEGKFIEEHTLSKIEKVMRLHREMEVNLEGIEVILDLLERMDGMNMEMNQLKNRLRFYEAIAD